MLQFNDGISFDTTGDYRVIRKSDGYYVVGHGMMFAVNSREEGREEVEQLNKERKEQK